jgi:hypothetical protein
MKKIFLSLILLLALPLASLCQTDNSGVKWIGKYHFEDPELITYDLKIRDDNSVVYEAEGIQTFFEVECIGKVNGSYYEIYFLSTKDGAYLPEDWIDVTKPIILLSYKNNILYTAEPQFDEPASKKFKKIN